MKTILLTWATWYIGSHWAVALLERDYNVVIVDNLSNSSSNTIDKINEIVNKFPSPSRRGARGEVLFYEIDLRNKEKLEQVFLENKIDWVIHFAWAKAVWESCSEPFYYYDNNVVWSLNLFELMDKYDVKNIIFSSSATVYDPAWIPPFTEKDLTWDTTNPYGTTKFIIENILRDLSNHKWFNVINLRYFNPVWAHCSWLIWEDPNDIPNNLLPFIMKVATWELKQIQVFWDDYNTTDGTWERDYIHVVDLIEGHIRALEFIENNLSPLGGKYPKGDRGIYEIFNLWTWTATSVLEMIKITEEIVWCKLNYKIVERRAWDLASSFCNPTKAKEILDWETKLSIKEAIEDSWNFIKNKG